MNYDYEYYQKKIFNVFITDRIFQIFERKRIFFICYEEPFLKKKKKRIIVKIEISRFKIFNRLIIIFIKL